MAQRYQRSIIVIAVIGLALFGAFYVTQYIESHAEAQALLTDFGYPGALLLAFVFGISAVIPVPPGSFAPAFVAAGLSLPIIIVMLTLGTTLADLVGYYLGQHSREFIKERFPRTYRLVAQVRDKPAIYLYVVVFAYAAFVPLPNEALVIPLGVIGYHIRSFIIPLVLATLTNHTATSLGAAALFSLFT